MRLKMPCYCLRPNCLFLQCAVLHISTYVTLNALQHSYNYLFISLVYVSNFSETVSAGPQVACIGTFAEGVLPASGATDTPDV